MKSSLPMVFISYSWESVEHNYWVMQLARRLESDNVKVIIDRNSLSPGDELTAFMERSIHSADFALIIVTAAYKNRADARKSGVGYEARLISDALLSGKSQLRVIPILRGGEWRSAAPHFIASLYYLDFRDEPYNESSYSDLLGALKPAATPRPVYGTKDFANSLDSPNQENSSEIQPIRVLRLCIERVSQPSNDAVHGSALYNVPFQLSQSPTTDWINRFIRNWNHPARFTNMHRPGIVRIAQDLLWLNGTTVDEIAKHHRETLTEAVRKTNEDYLINHKDELTAEKLRKQELQRHLESVRKAASNIDFD